MSREGTVYHSKHYIIFFWETYLVHNLDLKFLFVEGLPYGLKLSDGVVHESSGVAIDKFEQVSGNQVTIMVIAKQLP
jgi:hypothetical protein